MKRRLRKLIEIARYARAATPGELLGWDDVDTIRFHELYQALVELTNSEGNIKSATEDF